MLGEMGKSWQVCAAVPRPPSIKWHMLVCVGGCGRCGEGGAGGRGGTQGCTLVGRGGQVFAGVHNCRQE